MFKFLLDPVVPFILGREKPGRLRQGLDQRSPPPGDRAAQFAHSLWDARMARVSKWRRNAAYLPAVFAPLYYQGAWLAYEP